ncbi:MAG: nucleotidyltransferase family protein [Actinomycetota bacterium]|nr:nucleotidyltransferase family protein [Actinomycetota bacterium]
MPAREDPFQPIKETLKRAIAALDGAGVDFLVAGSIAAWARGGPASSNDLDFVVRREQAERALAALVDAGMRPEHPPEDWLLKAWDGDVLVDLIFVPTGIAVDDELFARGEQVDVAGYEMPVMALEDVLTTQLLSMDEHKLDYETPVQIARSLREQVDWDELRSRTADSPFAKAFFVLVEELGVVPPATREPARE